MGLSVERAVACRPAPPAPPARVPGHRAWPPWSCGSCGSCGPADDDGDVEDDRRDHHDDQVDDADDDPCGPCGCGGNTDDEYDDGRSRTKGSGGMPSESAPSGLKEPLLLCPNWRDRWRRRRRRWRRPPHGPPPPPPCSSGSVLSALLWCLARLASWSTSASRSMAVLWIALLVLGAASPARAQAGFGLQDLPPPPPPGLGSGTVLSPQTDSLPASKETVCRSVDIRNTVESFVQLQNCTVVEGSVQIVLIENAQPANYTNITFPKLREITGYLFLYRVSGLRSLSTMFPNLSVIRGDVLFASYALVIYEMFQLNDIGLVSLMSIMRGSIRIEKNPVLCYVDTIDWAYIAHSGEENFMKENKAGNECPRKCPEGCPSYKQSKSLVLKTTSHLCWTDSHCQKICKAECEKSGCLPNGDCCDKQCVGGCIGPKSSDCIACKEVSFNNICVANCPVHMYKFLNRRCVHDCYDQLPPRELETKQGRSKTWRPFNESCVQDCPPGYSEVQVPVPKSNSRSGELNYFTCTKCNDAKTCEKECHAETVNSIARAQSLRDCTVITNSLEIQVRGGKDLVKEIERSLESIREIHGYLKIVRSFPLVSLNFLKNLKVIRGKELENGKNSLVIMDNANLEKLWDWSANSTFSIKQGKVFFHFNPKLCIKEIEAFRKKAGLAKFDEHEMSETTNGDKVACDIEELNVEVTKLSDKAAVIQWSSFQTTDPRTLLGYVVYRIEAPFQNVTLYDGRDACGGDGWTVDDSSAGSSNIHIFTGLQPYTQYAYYVKTYTVATGSPNSRGAQSKIKYFRTHPSQPSPPRDLRALPNSSSEIVIQWLPSAEPNGNITKYIVHGVMETEIPDRNSYCDDPLIERPPDSIIDRNPKTTEAPPIDKSLDNDTCSCSSKGDTDVKKREKEAENSIAFEDLLHNEVYIRRDQEDPKRKDSSAPRYVSDEEYLRYKRSVGQDSRFPANPEAHSTSSANHLDLRENCTSGVCYSFLREVPVKETSIVVRNLHHYARYSIKVMACREIDPAELNIQDKIIANCSREAIINQRTLAKESADNISPPEPSEKNGTLIFSWSPPPNPNGMVVKYDIQIQAENSATSSPQLHCLPRTTTFFQVPRLSPGNYSFRVCATSLNGPGNFTEKKFFSILETSTTDTQTLLYVFLGIFMILVVAGIASFYARKTWCPSQVPPVKLITHINPDYQCATYIPDEWEVERKDIQIIKELGQGSFGMVYEGIIRNCPRTGVAEQVCAIKTVNQNSNYRERVEFLNEASVMKAFKTHHVVRLLGVVSIGQPTFVVMELMAKGDLKTYLRKHRPDESDDPNVQPPTLRQILRMAMEVADGMAYLAAKKFVHRDLAARNCMVAEDMTVKIGDFGMTKDIYETDYYRKGSKGLMPVRWMSPESLKDGVFTSASDVWSYGVVLWEMATLASQPYQGLSNEQVLRYVRDGGVMEAPENCPQQLYDLMRRCWQFKKELRPTFMTIVEMLLPDAESLPSFNARSFYHSSEGAEIRHPPEVGLAPLEEGELDADIEAISPRTPLRCAVHDIEDFDLEGTDSETEQAEQSGMPAPAPTSYAQYQKAYSSDSSRDSKASNGSSANANTANGYIHDHWHRHGNGATSHASHPTHSSHHGPPPTLKTTEC